MPHDGTYTTRLLEKFGDRMSLDIAELSEHNLEFVMERLVSEGQSTEAVTGIMINADLIDAPDDTYDRVFLPQVFEAVPDWQTLLSETAPVLKSSGKAVLSIRNLHSWFGLNYALRLRRFQIPNLGPSRPIPSALIRKKARHHFLINDEFVCSPLPSRIAQTVRDVPGRYCRLYILELSRA